MDLLDSLRALTRRWPITLTLLGVTIVSTVATLLIVPWQYESQATVVFLSSAQGSKPVGGNPWLAFDGSLTITAEVVARGMSDETTIKELRSKGLTADYTVGLAQDSRGPLMDIAATAAEPKIAQSTMEALVLISQARLAELQRQAGITADATIRSATVTATERAEIMPEKKVRLLVIVVAAGLLLTIAVPLFLESIAHKAPRDAASLFVWPETERPVKDPDRGR